MVIFKAINTIPEKLKVKGKAYIQIMNLLSISQKNCKDSQGINIMVFGIKIDTILFIAHLAKEKLEKISKAANKILN